MLAENSVTFSLNVSKDTVKPSSYKPTEKSLVEAAKNGQSTAFGMLFEPYSKQLFWTAQKITRCREDAEDAVQDAVLRAFVHLGDFDSRSTFGTWLTRIVINSALMILRKKRNAPVVDLTGSDHREGELTFEIPDRAPNPEMVYAQREQERIVKKAVRNLRPTLREIVQKQQLQENSMRETASAMGISLAAAKARLFHAKAALRRSSVLKLMRRRAGNQIRVLKAA